MWNLWLEKYRWYERASELTCVERKQVSNVVGRIESQSQLPFVNKNLRHNQRIRMLAELFPNAMFLVVVRDPVQVAVSVLRGRLEQRGDSESWFSIKPRSFSQHEGESPGASVVLQIKGLLDDLAEDITVLDATRVRVLEYERFCVGPSAVLRAVSEWAESCGANLAVKQEPPASFEVSTRTDGVSRETIDEVAALVETMRMPSLASALQL